MWYVTSTSNTLFSYISTANNFKYAKGYTYQNDMYTLNNESVTFWDITNENNKNSLNNAHYTCFNDSGECSTLAYIHFINGYTLKSISLTNNKKIEEVLKEMLSVDDVNKKSSTIKDAVEMWYQKYLFEYDNFIEDSIYC